METWRLGDVETFHKFKEHFTCERREPPFLFHDPEEEKKMWNVIHITQSTSVVRPSHLLIILSLISEQN